MILLIVADGNFFSTYGGGQVYVRSLVEGFRCYRPDIKITVLSNQSTDKASNPNYYHNIPLYAYETAEEFRDILTTVNPDIVHTNGDYVRVLDLCHELGIKCVTTIHDCRWVCPNVTYINPSGKLCNKKTTIEQCLKCELGRIRFGKWFYPIVKHFSIDHYIRLGQWLSKKKFIYILTPVGMAAGKLKEKIDYWQIIIQKSNIVILLSTRMSRMALLNGLQKEKMRYVPNGILPPQRHYPTVDTKISDRIKFYYVGRISESKGIQVLLKAFHKFSNELVELHIIGSGSKYMLDLQKKYNKDKRIIWHGEVAHEEMEMLCLNFHVLIQPSIGNECCPLSIIEALSIGKYVIATQCGGPADQIVEGVNGTLIQPNDVDALLKAIQDYVLHPIVPRSIIYNDMNAHINQLVALYQEII